MALTVAAVAPFVALPAAGWAARWGVDAAEAEGLLASMPPGTVERVDGGYRLSPWFVAEYGEAFAAITAWLDDLAEGEA